MYYRLKKKQKFNAIFTCAEKHMNKKRTVWTSLLIPHSRVLLEKPTGLRLVTIFPTFMEPKGSLPHSQMLATRPYPEPAQSSPYSHIPLPEIHLNIIYPPTPGSPQWSLSLRFPYENPVYASPLPIHATFPSHLIFCMYIEGKVGLKMILMISMMMMMMMMLPAYS